MLRASAAYRLSIDICCRRPRSAANQPHAAAAVNRRDRQTDGRTPDRYIDPAPHTTMQAASKTAENDYTQQLSLKDSECTAGNSREGSDQISQPESAVGRSDTTRPWLITWIQLEGSEPPFNCRRALYIAGSIVTRRGLNCPVGTRCRR